jgi:hypothetical protein
MKDVRVQRVSSGRALEYRESNLDSSSREYAHVFCCSTVSMLTCCISFVLFRYTEREHQLELEGGE